MKHTLALALLFLIVTRPLLAQEKVAEEEKRTLIQKVAQTLENNYVFPGKAKAMSAWLFQALDKGEYADIGDPQLLAQAVTNDLQSISHDRHLRLLYEPERILRTQQGTTTADSLKRQEAYNRWLKETNYGLKEVQVLPGNIGYLNLTRFSEPELASAKFDAVLEFLKDTDAIVIDLRQNGGGTPQMVQYIISYFFSGEPFLLNSFYKREGDYTKQFWTLPHPTAKRLPKVKLYVLTSTRTFSAAEEFAYDLKHLGRAKIVGEVTGGGAHPGGRITLSSKFNLWTPTARAINPVTGSNWEGIGVQPDIAVTAAEALKIAQINALEVLQEENVNIDHRKLIEELRSQ